MSRKRIIIITVAASATFAVGIMALTQVNKRRQARGAEAQPARWADSPPASVDFGNTAVGTTSSTVQRFNDDNGSPAPEAIHDVMIRDNDDQSFTLTNNCPQVLRPGNACQIDVQFSPRKVGHYDAKLVMNKDDVIGKNRTVVLANLSGTGTVPESYRQNNEAQQREEAREDKVASEKPSDSCYGSWFISLAQKSSAQTRAEYARNLNQAMFYAVGRYAVHISAAGEGNKFLLFSADPSDVSDLLAIANKYANDVDSRTRLCTEGFQEAQFLTRDSSFNQRLLTKVVPSVKETFNYAQKVAGAHPE